MDVQDVAKQLRDIVRGLATELLDIATALEAEPGPEPEPRRKFMSGNIVKWCGRYYFITGDTHLGTAGQRRWEVLWVRTSGDIGRQWKDEETLSLVANV